MNLAQQLVHSATRCIFIIGPVNSGESLATVPIVAKAGMPNIVIGAIDELIDPKKYPRAFRVINTNDAMDHARPTATRLDVLKRSKVAMIGDTIGLRHARAPRRRRSCSKKRGVKPVYSVARSTPTRPTSPTR